MNTIVKTTLRFITFLNAVLVTFADNIVDKMTGNPYFPTPMVDLASITGANNAFKTSIQAAASGDRIAIADRNAKRQVLIDLLVQQAAYVQGVAAGDRAVLVSSGFEAASSNRAQIELPQPVTLGVDNSNSGQLVMRIKAVRTAKAYEAQIKSGTGDWVPAGICTTARRIQFDDLTPGTTYTLRVRAIGGLTGFSPWSDPVSRMSM